MELHVLHGTRLFISVQRYLVLCLALNTPLFVQTRFDVAGFFATDLW